MNKQQLASKIWEAANNMRSKIEASEYKDYILGFIFYKFVSENEEREFRDREATEEEIKETSEDSSDAKSIKRKLGYFIHYNNLFSTWLKKEDEFSVDDVITALNAFSRLNYTAYNEETKKVEKTIYYNIFNTLETGLSKLGENSSTQTKAIKELIRIIKDIPIDDKDGYDVLGFIYEYLISNFAANAGKKAGEFYTPHEVSLLMSEIIAEHLKNRSEIKIYDPTSGSGSLLINIGGAVAKHIPGRDKIKFYAQELKENTYNLTRMNLIMRGINPANITVRCGDTLDKDWPLFDENDPEGTYEPLCNLDAVVSNPPYSQKWDPTNKENNPRFSEYGVAPKTKADYAFLLHDLYHLDSNGIMTIVLPHGVLFRGGDEGDIRKNLIEKNNIDAIIGLPANIFFGTGIPTIIMVLKKGVSRNDLDDVLIIDASKGFAKEGKNNKLRARDIKKIADTYNKRLEIPHFSRKVSRKEIRENDYNLNIPRYVDSSEKAESIDIYASMFGGIPKTEIKTLGNELEVFPSLTGELFTESDTPYVSTKTENAKAVIDANAQVVDFKKNYAQAFANFGEFLNTLLIDNMDDLVVARGETMIADEIFARLANIPLVDKYEAYQILDDKWQVIATDLEMIKTEGKAAITQVDPNIVTKKKGDKEEEYQDGWAGHVLPFELVQKLRLQSELDTIAQKESEVAAIQSEYDEILESIAEEDRGEFINEDGTTFVPKEIAKIIKPYAKGKIKPDAGSIEETLIKVDSLMTKEKNLNAELKKLRNELHLKTKELIEGLSIEEALPILYEKWVAPIVSAISVLPDSIVSALEGKIDTLTKKYSVRMIDIEAEIKESETALSEMIDELEGDEFDMLGLKELQKLLGGGKNE